MFLVLLSALPARAAEVLDVEPGDLVRVEVPDLPGAETTSETASVLLGPPDDPTLSWRPEPIPQVDGDTGWVHSGWSGTGDQVAWEAIEAMGIAPWHAAGFDGTGVKIAVFDVQWYGTDLRDDGELGAVQTHDCHAHRSCEPELDTLRPRYPYEIGSHGLACAEVVHDLAPGAELHLVRVNGLTTLENAARWAVREHIDVVSMSLSWFNESFYDGTGAVNAASDILTEGGVLLVNSAGNYADEHWNEPFRDTDGDGRHEFFVPDQPGGATGEYRESLPIWFGTGSASPTVIWDEFDACGRTDLDAYLYDGSGALVGRSTDAQLPDDGEGELCLPRERPRATIAEAGWHYLVVHRAAGAGAPRIDILGRGGTMWRAVESGSVTDPGSNVGVFTVGAVRADGYATNRPETFSSRGPSNAGVPKPDIAGPDGLSGTVYGQSGFYGTSAATPAVAAAIAVLMSGRTGLSARDAADLLAATAMADPDPQGTTGRRDNGLGAGRARLPPVGGTATGPCGPGGLVAVLACLPAWVFRRRGVQATPAWSSLQHAETPETA